jgi:hypothetical protein
MMRAYIIGPYTGKTHYETKQNIRRAEIVNEMLWAMGIAAYCPHILTAFQSGNAEESTYILGHLEWIKAADVAVTLPGWEQSSGSVNEINACKYYGIPVVGDIAPDSELWIDSPVRDVLSNYAHGLMLCNHCANNKIKGDCTQQKALTCENILEVITRRYTCTGFCAIEPTSQRGQGAEVMTEFDGGVEKDGSN